MPGIIACSCILEFGGGEPLGCFPILMAGLLTGATAVQIDMQVFNPSSGFDEGADHVQ